MSLKTIKLKFTYKTTCEMFTESFKDIINKYPKPALMIFTKIILREKPTTPIKELNTPIDYYI